MAQVIDRTEAFTVVGISERVNNDNPEAIGGLWGRFYGLDLAARLPNRLSDDVYCVYHAYEGDHRAPYQMTIGFKVARPTSPEGLSVVLIPAQRMAVYDASGEQPATLIGVWTKIWESPIARAFAADFDVHDAAEPGRVTVYVGVKD